MGKQLEIEKLQTLNLEEETEEDPLGIWRLSGSSSTCSMSFVWTESKYVMTSKIFIFHRKTKYDKLINFCKSGIIHQI